MAPESPQTIAFVAPDHLEIPGQNFRATANKLAPTVLVVDDEALIRWSVAETLRECGFRIMEARDGASAMRALSDATDPADAVLLDLYSPDSNDLRVLSAMLAITPRTPIILMTAHGSPELHEEARSLGAFSVLDKPFEMGVIAPLLERALATS